MSITECGTTIQSVYLVDDDPSVRKIYGFPIEELHLQSIHEQGPLKDIDIFIGNTIKSSQAAICDHRLRIRNYAVFNGAEAVAKFYQKKFPALLCTRSIEDNIMEIRSFKRFIPVLLDIDELEPQIVRSGFIKCIREFNNYFEPSRKPWRTLIRVEGIDETHQVLSVVVPAWDSSKEIQLRIDKLPMEIKTLIKNHSIRFHARVNLGAERAEDLYFFDWENQ